jgi:hypothetical protein
LFILLAVMPSICAREATLESNIVFFLSEAGLNETIKFVGRSNNRDSVYAVPIEFDAKGRPALLWTMENTPQDWREVKSPLSLFDRFCHHGRWKSFRSTSTPSLHVIVFRERDSHNNYHYWFHIHFDTYVPSLSKPWGTVQHMSLEVIPRLVFGTRTSQSRIEDELYKRKP